MRMRCGRRSGGGGGQGVPHHAPTTRPRRLRAPRPRRAAPPPQAPRGRPHAPQASARTRCGAQAARLSRPPPPRPAERAGARASPGPGTRVGCRPRAARPAARAAPCGAARRRAWRPARGSALPAPSRTPPAAVGGGRGGGRSLAALEVACNKIEIGEGFPDFDFGRGVGPEAGLSDDADGAGGAREACVVRRH